MHKKVTLTISPEQQVLFHHLKKTDKNFNASALCAKAIRELYAERKAPSMPSFGYVQKTDGDIVLNLSEQAQKQLMFLNCSLESLLEDRINVAYEEVIRKAYTDLT